MARPLPKPHGRPQGAGGGRGASRPDSLSATTTDALFAGKVQRKVSNGIAGLAAAGSSRHRQKIVPIPASASKGGRTPRTLYRRSNGALRSPARHCACGYDGNSRARNPRKTPQISPIPCSAARRPLGRSRRAMHVSQTQNGDVEKHPPAPKGAHHYRSKASAQEQASRPSFDTNPI
jgi:hypothetical protein